MSHVAQRLEKNVAMQLVIRDTRDELAAEVRDLRANGWHEADAVTMITITRNGESVLYGFRQMMMREAQHGKTPGNHQSA